MTFAIPGNGALVLPAASTLAARPVLGDSSQQLVDAGFVQRAIGNRNAFNLVNGAGSLPLSYCGGSVFFSGVGAYAVTLPDASAVPAGTQIELINSMLFAVTLNRLGSNLIYPGGQSGGLTSLTLGNDVLVLESNGVNWFGVSGGAQLAYTGLFGASLGANGYQKLPSGLIFQWGQIPSFGAAGTAAQTFPIAFLSVCYGVTGTPYGGSQGTLEIFSGPTTTGVTFGEGSGQRNIGGGTYMAIGR